MQCIWQPSIWYILGILEDKPVAVEILGNSDEPQTDTSSLLPEDSKEESDAHADKGKENSNEEQKEKKDARPKRAPKPRAKPPSPRMFEDEDEPNESEDIPERKVAEWVMRTFFKI